MYFTYVLYSENYDRIYIGMTNDINNRLNQHNAGLNPSTKSYLPWRIIHSEAFVTRMEARQKEIKLKTSSARRYIRKNYL